jgi:hypothetical protein
MKPVITDDKKAEFFIELEALYMKYDISLGHEDHQGAFTIEKLKQDNIEWVRAATVRWEL